MTDVIESVLANGYSTRVTEAWLAFAVERRELDPIRGSVVFLLTVASVVMESAGNSWPSTIHAWHKTPEISKPKAIFMVYEKKDFSSNQGANDM